VPSGRDRETKRFGGLEVDDELELRRLLDREVSRLSSFKNAIHEICRTSIQTANVHAVTNETSGLGVFPGSYRGQFVRKRKRRDRWKTSSKFPVLGNHDRIDAALGHGSESKTELAGTLRPGNFDYQTQGRGGRLHRWNDRSADRIVGI
jgi:hypothetical protein